MNDYLLPDSITTKANFVTANDLLPRKKQSLTLPNDILNLYTSLVKRIDFTRRKLVGAVPFFTIKTEDVLEVLPSSYKIDFYWKLRKAFSFYNSRKRIGRAESFRLWFKKESFPATLIRLIANIASSNKNEELEILSDLLKKIQFVDNFQSVGKIYLPKNLNELNNRKLMYFVGCATGDGGFSEDDYWSIVDGDKTGNLKYSFQHLIHIKKILQELFKIKFTAINPKQRGNRVVLWVANKWFGRFINFYFGLQYGKRQKIEIPKIFDLFSNSSELIKMFLRGFFDAEGYCGIKGNLSVSSSDHSFLRKCKNIFSDLRIKTWKINGNNLPVRGESCIEFLNNVGFSHPKKLKNILTYVRHRRKTLSEEELLKIENKLTEFW